MPRSLPSDKLMLLMPDPKSQLPMYRQLYAGLRQAILTRQLPPGTRLPSTRVLVKDWGVSRNTILNAYDQLIAEGYLVSQHGSGTFVAEFLPEINGSSIAPQAEVTSIDKENRKISQRGMSLMKTPQMPQKKTKDHSKPRAFLPTIPDIDAFPRKVWGRLLNRRWQQASHADLHMFWDRAGYRPLREAIAAYLATSRGVRCTADQVIMVSGSQQGIDLVARVLLDRGDAVWMENPGYLGASGAFLAAGAEVIPVSVDKEGLDISAGMAIAPNARLAFVTPSHQFPLGVTMSLKRRLALLDWANQSGAWVLEDDYDSEYRYVGRPLAALQGLDRDGRILYLGTFSKVMFSGLRVGYLVVPEDLVDVFVAALFFATAPPPVLEQMVLADFITEGHFARHIRRTRMLYSERQAALIESAQRELAGLLDVQASEAGLHLLGWLPKGVDDRLAAQMVANQGVDTFPLSTYQIGEDGQRRQGALLLGYTAIPKEEIVIGVQQLGDALRLMTTTL